MIPEEYKDLLEKKGFAHVATIGPKGEPQSNPVWFDWDGKNVLFSQTKTRQKVANLEDEPRIAISIQDPENPYRYLEIRGRVASVDEDTGNKFINSMAKKYMDKDEYPWHQPGDERVVVRVEPVHTSQMG